MIIIADLAPTPKNLWVEAFNLAGRMGTTECTENTENEEVVKFVKLILQARSQPSLDLLPSACSEYSVVTHSEFRFNFLLVIDQKYRSYPCSELWVLLDS